MERKKLTKVQGAWTEFPPAAPTEFPAELPAGTLVTVMADLPNDDEGNKWVIVGAKVDGRELYAPVPAGLLANV